LPRSAPAISPSSAVRSDKPISDIGSACCAASGRSTITRISSFGAVCLMLTSVAPGILRIASAIFSAVGTSTS
jgi:hypothetical protein